MPGPEILHRGDAERAEDRGGIQVFSADLRVAVKVFGIPLANNAHPFALRYRRAATNRRGASIPQPERRVAVRHGGNPNSFTTEARRTRRTAEKACTPPRFSAPR